MKISKDRESFKVVLPKDKVQELGWKHGTKLKARKYGKKLILEVEDEKSI